MRTVCGTGEHSAWAKHTNFDTDTAIPMLLRVPGLTHGGTTSGDALVEAIDVLPTLYAPIPRRSVTVMVCY